MSNKLFRILSAVACIVGVIMLIVSFSINPRPPSDTTSAQLIAFGNQNYTSILWGAWLQAVGPLLTVLFAFALVCLAGATTRLAGWMTLLGGGHPHDGEPRRDRSLHDHLREGPSDDGADQPGPYSRGPAPLLLRGSTGALPASGSGHFCVTCAPSGARLPGTGARSRLCDF